MVIMALTPQAVFANEGEIQSDFRLENLSDKEVEAVSKKELDIELELSFWNGFTDADLFEQVSGPTQDLYLTVGVAEGLSLVVWNIQSIKLDPQVGDELYLAVAYERPFGEDLTLRTEAGRSFTEGFNNMWIFSGEVRYRDVDFSIMEFVVDNGPRLDPAEGEDATRFQLGYSLPETKGVTSRFMLTHEQGFGLPTITTIGVEAELPLDDRWTLRGEVFAPLFKESFDDRNTAVMVGISYRF